MNYEQKLQSIDLSQYENIDSIDILKSLITKDYDIIGFNSNGGICKSPIKKSDLVKESYLDNILSELNSELSMK